MGENNSMGGFTVVQTGIDGLVEIQPTVFGDERGYFVETYNKREFETIGLNMSFVQDNQSASKKGVLRGLHFQKQNPQGKLVRVLSGEVFDVGVDLRKNSPTFGHWHGIILSGTNKKMFYVPEGFAHGFVVLSDFAEFTYKCTRFYDPKDEGGILWNDPEINVNWHIPDDMSVILSEKDKKNPPLKNLEWSFE
jgi:dTDP-4-dehydrorhamnose 3,5-epimerase